MLNITLITALIMAYLFGSISSAIIVCKLMRLPDPRTTGSHNPGATNVLRIGGKKAAAITLLGDSLKGFIPVMIAHALAFSSLNMALIALAALLGHLYPIFFRFQGGKGVATFIGCLIALSWPTALCWGITWLVVAALFRYSSLAALIACALAPFYSWFFNHSMGTSIVLAVMAVMIFYRHRENITKLISGTESRIGQKAKS